MLILPLKVPTRYDIRKPLAKWLDERNDEVPANPLHYVHVRPNFFSKDCQSDLVRLASLRNCLSDSLLTRSHKVALQELALPDAHEYYAALVEFETRGFPTADEMVIMGRNQDDCLQMEWSDAMEPQQLESHASLIWERACAAYSIAALESYLASSIEAHDRDSFKQVVKHCQFAASMMRHLREDIVGGHDFRTVDLSVPALQFWESVSLAQGQVAAYQMAKSSASSNNNPKDSLLSYVAMGSVPLWNDALKYSTDPLFTSQLPKPAEEWGAHCKVQSMLWSARAEYHQSIASRHASEWGVEMAWLDQTYTSIQACRGFVKKANVDNNLVHAVDSLYHQVHDRRSEAQKDNSTTYGERVPEQVPHIRAQQLVKSDLALPETMRKTKVALFQNIH